MNAVPAVIIIVLTLYSAIGVLDQISVQIGPYTPLFGGAITGLLMGNLPLGLTVGATLQLMTLGVATYGGATVPDFLSGSIMGTAYAILSNQGAEYGIGLAVPIGLLLTQLDVLGRMANTAFQHRADRHAEVGNWKGVERCNLLGMIPWTLSRMIPVFIGLAFGEQVVTAINAFIPEWIITGLRVAGQILPAMGIAILMRYLPLKKYYPYYIIGFVVMAFGAASGFTILGVALIGFAMAAIHVMRKNNAATAVSTAGAPVSVDDEEVEIDE